MTLRLLGLTLFGCAVLLPAPVSGGQPAQGMVERALVQEDPAGPLVAVTFRFSAGSAQDPEGEEGTALLLAEALEDGGGDRLARLGGLLQVEVDRSTTVITLLAPPESWGEAVAAVQDLLTSSPPSETRIQALRDQHLSRLVFEEGAPVRRFERERNRLVLDASHPGARPLAGTRESVERISAGAVHRFLGQVLSLDEAAAAVVGPVSAAEVERVLGVAPDRMEAVPPFQRAEPPSQQPSPPGATAADRPDTLGADETEDLPPPPRVRLRETPFQPLEVPSATEAAMAWSAPDRIVVDEQLTSTWMAVAWPFPRGTSLTLLGFLAHTLEETLVPSPPERGQYSTHVSVEHVEGDPVLVFSATVDPRVAGRWEDRIVQGMGTMAESPPTGSFFELGRRRYRSRVLLNTAAPDDRARWLLEQLDAAGEVPAFHDELWRLSEEVLARVASAAGPPKVLLLGPRAMMEREGG